MALHEQQKFYESLSETIKENSKEKENRSEDKDVTDKKKDNKKITYDNIKSFIQKKLNRNIDNKLNYFGMIINSLSDKYHTIHDEDVLNLTGIDALDYIEDNENSVLQSVFIKNFLMEQNKIPAEKILEDLQKNGVNSKFLLTPPYIDNMYFKTFLSYLNQNRDKFFEYAKALGVNFDVLISKLQEYNNISEPLKNAIMENMNKNFDSLAKTLFEAKTAEDLEKTAAEYGIKGFKGKNATEGNKKELLFSILKNRWNIEIDKNLKLKDMITEAKKLIKERFEGISKNKKFESYKEAAKNIISSLETSEKAFFELFNTEDLTIVDKMGFVLNFKPKNEQEKEIFYKKVFNILNPENNIQTDTDTYEIILKDILSLNHFKKKFSELNTHSRNTIERQFNELKDVVSTDNEKIYKAAGINPDDFEYIKKLHNEVKEQIKLQHKYFVPVMVEKGDEIQIYFSKMDSLLKNFKEIKPENYEEGMYIKTKKPKNMLQWAEQTVKEMPLIKAKECNIEKAKKDKDRKKIEFKDVKLLKNNDVVSFYNFYETVHYKENVKDVTSFLKDNIILEPDEKYKEELDFYNIPTKHNYINSETGRHKNVFVSPSPEGYEITGLEGLTDKKEKLDKFIEYYLKPVQDESVYSKWEAYQKLIVKVQDELKIPKAEVFRYLKETSIGKLVLDKSFDDLNYLITEIENIKNIYDIEQIKQKITPEFLELMTKDEGEYEILEQKLKSFLDQADELNLKKEDEISDIQTQRAQILNNIENHLEEKDLNSVLKSFGTENKFKITNNINFLFKDYIQRASNVYSTQEVFEGFDTIHSMLKENENIALNDLVKEIISEELLKEKPNFSAVETALILSYDKNLDEKEIFKFSAELQNKITQIKKEFYSVKNLVDEFRSKHPEIMEQIEEKLNNDPEITDYKKRNEKRKELFYKYLIEHITKNKSDINQEINILETKKQKKTDPVEIKKIEDEITELKNNEKKLKSIEKYIISIPSLSESDFNVDKLKNSITNATLKEAFFNTFKNRNQFSILEQNLQNRDISYEQNKNTVEHITKDFTDISKTLNKIKYGYYQFEKNRYQKEEQELDKNLRQIYENEFYMKFDDYFKGQTHKFNDFLAKDENVRKIFFKEILIKNKELKEDFLVAYHTYLVSKKDTELTFREKHFLPKLKEIEKEQDVKIETFNSLLQDKVYAILKNIHPNKLPVDKTKKTSVGDISYQEADKVWEKIKNKEPLSTDREKEIEKIIFQNIYEEIIKVQNKINKKVPLSDEYDKEIAAMLLEAAEINNSYKEQKIKELDIFINNAVKDNDTLKDFFEFYSQNKIMFPLFDTTLSSVLELLNNKQKDKNKENIRQNLIGKLYQYRIDKEFNFKNKLVDIMEKENPSNEDFNSKEILNFAEDVFFGLAYGSDNSDKFEKINQVLKDNGIFFGVINKTYLSLLRTKIEEKKLGKNDLFELAYLNNALKILNVRKNPNINLERQQNIIDMINKDTEFIKNIQSTSNVYDNLTKNYMPYKDKYRKLLKEPEKIEALKAIKTESLKEYERLNNLNYNYFKKTFDLNEKILKVKEKYSDVNFEKLTENKELLSLVEEYNSSIKNEINKRKEILDILEFEKEKDFFNKEGIYYKYLTTIEEENKKFLKDDVIDEYSKKIDKAEAFDKEKKHTLTRLVEEITDKSEKTKQNIDKAIKLKNTIMQELDIEGKQLIPLLFKKPSGTDPNGQTLYTEVNYMIEKKELEKIFQTFNINGDSFEEKYRFFTEHYEKQLTVENIKTDPKGLFQTITFQDNRNPDNYLTVKLASETEEQTKRIKNIENIDTENKERLKETFHEIQTAHMLDLRLLTEIESSYQQAYSELQRTKEQVFNTYKQELERKLNEIPSYRGGLQTHVVRVLFPFLLIGEALQAWNAIISEELKLSHKKRTMVLPLIKDLQQRKTEMTDALRKAKDTQKEIVNELDDLNQMMKSSSSMDEFVMKLFENKENSKIAKHLIEELKIVDLDKGTVDMNKLNKFLQDIDGILNGSFTDTESGGYNRRNLSLKLFAERMQNKFIDPNFKDNLFGLNILESFEEKNTRIVDKDVQTIVNLMGKKYIVKDTLDFIKNLKNGDIKEIMKDEKGAKVLRNIKNDVFDKKILKKGSFKDLYKVLNSEDQVIKEFNKNTTKAVNTSKGKLIEMSIDLNTINALRYNFSNVNKNKSAKDFIDEISSTISINIPNLYMENSNEIKKENIHQIKKSLNSIVMLDGLNQIAGNDFISDDKIVKFFNGKMTIDELLKETENIKDVKAKELVQKLINENAKNDENIKTLLKNIENSLLHVKEKDVKYMQEEYKVLLKALNQNTKSRFSVKEIKEDIEKIEKNKLKTKLYENIINKTFDLLKLGKDTQQILKDIKNTVNSEIFKDSFLQRRINESLKSLNSKIEEIKKDTNLTEQEKAVKINEEFEQHVRKLKEQIPSFIEYDKLNNPDYMDYTKFKQKYSLEIDEAKELIKEAQNTVKEKLLKETNIEKTIENAKKDPDLYRSIAKTNGLSEVINKVLNKEYNIPGTLELMSQLEKAVEGNDTIKVAKDRLQDLTQHMYIKDGEYELNKATRKYISKIYKEKERIKTPQQNDNDIGV